MSALDDLHLHLHQQLKIYIYNIPYNVGIEN